MRFRKDFDCSLDHYFYHSYIWDNRPVGFPKRHALMLGSGLGVFLYLVLKKRRRIALKNLQIAFGDAMSTDERAKICRRSFRQVGKTAIEFLRFPKLTFDNVWEEVTVDGKEHLIQALDKGKGAIVFLPTLGIGNCSRWSMGHSSRVRQRQLRFRLKIDTLTRLSLNIENNSV